MGGSDFLRRRACVRRISEREHALGSELENHTIVTFRFGNVVQLSLSGFNNQNAIMDLLIESAGKHPNGNMPAYRVTFEPSFGLDCSFLCSSIEVSGVERRIPPDSVCAEGENK